MKAPFTLRPSSFRFRIGPGLALALLALALLWPVLRGATPRPVIRRDDGSALPAPPAAPDLDWVLAHGRELRLSPSQTRALEERQPRWRRDTRALREELDRASADFNRTMAGNAPRTMQQLQEGALPASQLSRQLAEARRSDWEGAARLLTPEQRRTAERSWSEHPFGKDGTDAASRD